MNKAIKELFNERMVPALGIILISAAVVGYGLYNNQPSQPKLTFQTQPLKPIDTPSTEMEGPPVVHVAGAVKSPGVYTLKPKARVVDAIRAAGGTKPNADIEAWNLAAKVKDGMQIYVSPKVNKGAQPALRARSGNPRQLRGELPVQVQIPPGFEGRQPPIAQVQPEGQDLKTTDKTPARPHSGKKDLPEAGSININSATTEELQRLPGIGPATAEKIIEFRTQSGGFKTVDDLLTVRGIGPKKLEAIRPFVKL